MREMFSNENQGHSNCIVHDIHADSQIQTIYGNELIYVNEILIGLPQFVYRHLYCVQRN